MSSRIYSNFTQVWAGPSRGREGPGTIFRSGPARNFKLYCVFLKGSKLNTNHSGIEKYLLRLLVGRGGVLNSPRFCLFSLFFPCRKLGYRSWVIPLCSISEPMSTRLLNSISSEICRQNTQFNMYTTTSKQQEGCRYMHFRFLSKMVYNDKF